MATQMSARALPSRLDSDFGFAHNSLDFLAQYSLKNDLRNLLKISSHFGAFRKSYLRKIPQDLGKIF